MTFFKKRVALKGEDKFTLEILTTAHGFHDLISAPLPILLPLIIQEFRMSYGLAGLLLTSRGIISTTLQPFINIATERFGIRKIPIMLGSLWFGISYLLLSFAPDVSLLFVFAAISGVGIAFYHPQATAYVSHYYPETRGKAMGIHGFGGGFGAFISPLIIATIASSLGWRIALQFLLVPALIPALLLFRLKEIGAKSRVRIDVRGVLTPALLLLILVQGFIGSLGFSAIHNFAPTFLVQGLGFPISFAGVLVTLASSSMVVGEPFCGWLSDRLGRRVVLSLAGFLQAVFILFFVWLPYPFSIVSLLGLFFLGYGTSVVTWTFASELVPPEAVATSVAFQMMLTGYIGLTSTAITGWLIEEYWFYTAFMFPVAMSFIGGLAAWGLPKETKRAK